MAGKGRVKNSFAGARTAHGRANDRQRATAFRDLCGRKVLERRLSEGGDADGALTLSPPAGLHSGVSFIRLSSGPLVVASVRVVMIQ